MHNLISRRWWWTTLLALAAVGVMIRLGIWQLDRLEQRQAFNARVTAQIERPALHLDDTTLRDPSLTNMEYRAVIVEGQYDHAQQVAIRNQAWDNQYGVHLLTPLVISGTQHAVLVDRGWIPTTDTDPLTWRAYDEPGVVQVKGMIRASRATPDFGGIPDPPPVPGEQLLAWNNVNVLRIDQQVSYPLVPIYIQQAPDPSWTSMPYRDQPDLDLSEGPHMGYAMQWFLFATVLALGYPMFVRHHSTPRSVSKQVKESLG